MEDREGLVAENEMMGTRDLSPRRIKKVACMEDAGPMIA